MIFLIDNVVWIVCLFAGLGAICAAFELITKKTRGVLASVSLILNAAGVVVAFIGGMELLTLAAILLAEFLILAFAYAARS